MNTKMLKTARRLWMNDLTPRHIARRNVLHWVRSIRMLGDKWLLAQPVRRSA